jgi:uncharacterized protein DUF4239
VPIWLYEVRPLYAGLALVVLIESISLIGLLLVRRFVLPHLNYGEGGNEAVSGTVQAIGVFYGITVGLIAVGVWNTHSSAADLVSKEATAIATLYRDVGGYPEPVRTELRSKLREYTVFLIEKAWPAQRRGIRQIQGGAQLLDQFQDKFHSFEPTTPGQQAVHGEALSAYNRMIELRRLRIDAVDNGLDNVMWTVIWLGAAISIGITYFFKIADPKLHAILIFLMAAFLALLIFMITINDRPFYGRVSISSVPYQLILDRVIDAK